MEPVIAREVIYDWNAAHAQSEKRALLPLDEKPGATADLLIAFFCSSQASTSDQSAQETETEIEAQLKAGGPALIYFSEARIALGGANVRQEQALAHYQKRYDSRATFHAFADEKEFRAKFAQDLAAIVESHPRFKPEGEASTPASAPAPKPAAAEVAAVVTTPAPTPTAPPPAKELSDCARTLLIEACEDFEAYIGRNKIGNTLRLQANGKQLVENNEPATIAKWDAAFNEILSGGYIRDAGCNGQLFQISPKGFAFLKGIGKSPVGYIAELGGM
jgi:hypothetical protein